MLDVKECPIHQLRPTQLTVGLMEVEEKVRHLSKLKAHEQRSFMQSHPIPAVRGPEDELYITDHHHLARAALQAGIKTGCVEVIADLSSHGSDEFWTRMDERGWVHPLDDNGVRHRYTAIPRHLEKLIDDVYRSLAGYVRAAGAYDKTAEVFAEFVWADFFRRHIPVEDLRDDFKAAVKRASLLAVSERAKGMPGFRGR